MASPIRMTLKELQTEIKTAIADSKVAVDATSLSQTNLISGLLNKVAEQIIVDGSFQDKLPELDAKDLPYGNIIEEWYQGLAPVKKFKDVAGNEATMELSPEYPDYEKPSYSQSFERPILKTTITRHEYNSAFTNGDGVNTISDLAIKRLYDTYNTYRYGLKKELLGKVVSKIDDIFSTENTWAAGSSYNKDTYVEDNDGNIYAVRKNITGNASNTIAKQLAAGELVKLNLKETLAVPTDEESGAKFITSVKNKIEEASFATEGNSLAGNVIGAEEGLILFVKKGVMPTIEVETLAGAFNRTDLVIPAKVKIVEDFGDGNNCWAMLVDSRAIKLHPQYFRVGETRVEAGDYNNYFIHTEQLGFISKFAFIHIWETAE